MHLITSPSCVGSDVIFGGSLTTLNSVDEVAESKEVLAVQEYLPLEMTMIREGMETVFPKVLNVRCRWMMISMMILGMKKNCKPVLCLQVVDVKSLPTAGNLQ